MAISVFDQFFYFIFEIDLYSSIILFYIILPIIGWFSSTKQIEV